MFVFLLTEEGSCRARQQQMFWGQTLKLQAPLGCPRQAPRLVPAIQSFALRSCDATLLR